MITEGKFKDPIYEFTVKVVIFDDIKEVLDRYNGIIDSSMSGCTIEHIGRPRCELVIPCDRMSTVVHELEHLKNLIWKYIGYTSQPGNDEPDAYMMSFLFEQVEKILKKHLASRC